VNLVDQSLVACHVLVDVQADDHVTGFVREWDGRYIRREERQALRPPLGSRKGDCIRIDVARDDPTEVNGETGGDDATATSKIDTGSAVQVGSKVLSQHCKNLVRLLNARRFIG